MNVGHVGRWLTLLLCLGVAIGTQVCRASDYVEPFNESSPAMNFMIATFHENPSNPGSAFSATMQKMLVSGKVIRIRIFDPTQLGYVNFKVKKGQVVHVSLYKKAFLIQKRLRRHRKKCQSLLVGNKKNTDGTYMAHVAAVELRFRQHNSKRPPFEPPFQNYPRRRR